MKKIFLIALLLLGAITLLPLNNFALDQMGDEIKLYVGQVKTVSVNNPTRIVIGNPSVADVGSVSKREVTLSPKSAGMTTLVIWDNFGENSYTVRVFAENMSEYKRRIDNILKKLNLSEVVTKAEDEEGKVYMTGSVRSAKDREQMLTALGGLKDKTLDLTRVKEDDTIVEIDVQVLELNKGATDTLGFTWPGSATFNITDASVATTGAGNFANLFTINKWLRDPLSFTLQVDFLIQEGKARILSRPRLSCQSGKEAKLLVGGEVPVLSASMSSGGSAGTSPSATPGNVEYKEYGIIMNIKPVVDENKRIHLNLEVEVSELGNVVETEYALAYTFTKRNASTEMWLIDGETMAIGGLIKKNDTETVRKFPWLADLPVLGMFFRQKTTTKGGGVDRREETELFLTLTPHIIKDATKDTKPEAEKKELKPVAAYYPIEESLDPVAKYSRLIQQRILENVIYPKPARDAGFQGTARLNLKLSYRGELMDVVVKKSSGYKLLDDNAVAAAKSNAVYPPFPPAIAKEELWIEVPVSYQLE